MVYVDDVDDVADVAVVDGDVNLRRRPPAGAAFLCVIHGSSYRFRPGWALWLGSKLPVIEGLTGARIANRRHDTMPVEKGAQIVFTDEGATPNLDDRDLL
jgi:hypothetical protein